VLLRSACLALAVTLLTATPVRAQDEDRLEEWQRQILRALEDAAPNAEGGGDARSDADDRQSYTRQPGTDAAAARAADEARRRYGGQPLAVVRVGDAYRVRLLLDSGRVTTVTIRD
jgi:hypothetical protein